MSNLKEYKITTGDKVTVRNGPSYWKGIVVKTTRLNVHVQLYRPTDMSRHGKSQAFRRRDGKPGKGSKARIVRVDWKLFEAWEART